MYQRQCVALNSKARRAIEATPITTQIAKAIHAGLRRSSRPARGAMRMGPRLTRSSVMLALPAKRSGGGEPGGGQAEKFCRRSKEVANRDANMVASTASNSSTHH